MTAAMLAMPAAAQDADDDEVVLDTLRIEDATADSNPYTQDGAPYKARMSGDTAAAPSRLPKRRRRSPC